MDENPDSRTSPPKMIRQVAEALARAFLAGEGSPVAMRERGTVALGRSWPWLVPLALHIHFELGPGFGVSWSAEQNDRVINLILAFPRFLAAFESGDEVPRVKGYFPFHTLMGRPPPPLSGIALPSLATPGDLADWLELSPAMLDWYADVASWDSNSRTPKLNHYHHRWQAKASGGARLIEAPKECLRRIQRRILRGILDRVPAHEAAHGCVSGRSVLSNARLHCGSSVIVKLDLRDFFVSIPGARVHAMFRTLGYPSEVARYLTGLTTHRTPACVLGEVPQEEYPSPEERRRRREWARRFMSLHLPQGAPTSPALANLCAYRMDLRLVGAARESQGRYSRYVDDLVFSVAKGSVAQCRRILTMVQNIILEEGFAPNWRKTRIVPASKAQRITGLVVNERPNVPRREFDQLKAILTNCCRHGPNSQNRSGIPDFRAYLQGRISWFEQVSVERGRRLRLLFERIAWV